MFKQIYKVGLFLSILYIKKLKLREIKKHFQGSLDYYITILDFTSNKKVS